MPASAYALFALFIAIAVVAGLVAWRIIAPAHRWGWVLPILFAFGALSVGGHQLRIELGPLVGVLGFQIALFGDVAMAAVAAFVGAVAWRLLALQVRRG